MRFSDQAKRFTALTYDLAATGRSSGVHLIISTQYPTSKYVSSDISLNFPARLCYSMPSLSGSLIMLQSNEGLNLYPPPGRCVWSFGVDRLKLQTPFVSNGQINSILKACRNGKPLKAVQLAASLTPEDLCRWALNENNNSLGIAAAFYKFGNLISHRDLEDLLQSMDDRTYTVDGIDYAIRPPSGGSHGRLLIKVASDDEARKDA